jgi:sodium transport system ATP-binding protein
MPTTASPPLGVHRSDHDASADSGARGDSLLMKGVCRRYGSRDVLRDVDLTLDAGESVLITGPNGAGKTTLLRVAGGLITPHAGAISIFGLDPRIRRSDCQRRIGYLPAGDRAIYARLTVRTNLEFWATIALVPRRARRDLVEKAIRDFELAEVASRRADRLSMGQRQRARLAMAFLHEPDLMLLDEPDSSLDEDGLRLLRAATEATLARGGSAVWCAPTGDREAIRSDRRYVIHDGVLEPA